MCLFDELIFFRSLGSRQYRTWAGWNLAHNNSLLPELCIQMVLLRYQHLAHHRDIFCSSCFQSIFQRMEEETKKFSIDLKKDNDVSSLRYVIHSAMVLIFLFQRQNNWYQWWWDTSAWGNTPFLYFSVVDWFETIFDWYLSICTTSWMVSINFIII